MLFCRQLSHDASGFGVSGTIFDPRIAPGAPRSWPLHIPKCGHDVGTWGHGQVMEVATIAGELQEGLRAGHVEHERLRGGQGHQAAAAPEEAEADDIALSL